MWTIPGLLGLVMLLLALAAETKSKKQQYLNSDTDLRIEFNNMERLQEVNTGSIQYIQYYSDSHITYTLTLFL